MSLDTSSGGGLLESFREGEEAAADPENQEVVAGGRASTNLRSRWLHLRCELCGHTFRVGDAVEVGADRKARHASEELPCSGGTFSKLPDATEAAAFFAGLDESWPPPAKLPVRRLEPGTPTGDSLLAPPVSGFRRHRCAVCGHTLRPHDQVVICPCFPEQPMCILAIHRDPVRSLNCWEAWNPGEVQQYCPATSRKLT
jgi:hypothetical protein